MSCHVCAAKAAETKQTRDGVHVYMYIMFVHDIHKHRGKRRDQPAAAKKLLLNNKRLNPKALRPSIPEACRSPCLREPLIFLAFSRQHVSYTYSPHTRHPHPHTRYRASCTLCRPDDHGISNAGLQDAGTCSQSASPAPRSQPYTEHGYGRVSLHVCARLSFGSWNHSLDSKIPLVKGGMRTRRISFSQLQLARLCCYPLDGRMKSKVQLQ